MTGRTKNYLIIQGGSESGIYFWSLAEMIKVQSAILVVQTVIFTLPYPKEKWSQNNMLYCNRFGHRRYIVRALTLRHTPRTSRKIPERPRKRCQSFSWNSRREYGWDPPTPIIQGSREHFQNSLPPVRLRTFRFFHEWFRRGPLRAGHGIPSSTGGISETCTA